jgi:hypothetical protein
MTNRVPDLDNVDAWRGPTASQAAGLIRLRWSVRAHGMGGQRPTRRPTTERYAAFWCSQS